ncbi:hypothetical protein NL676_010206 [Syzygium grande]|nr:hypothetical protein NL676_010206 [Syzygium grande]
MTKPLGLLRVGGTRKRAQRFTARPIRRAAEENLLLLRLPWEEPVWIRTGSGGDEAGRPAEKEEETAVYFVQSPCGANEGLPRGGSGPVLLPRWQVASTFVLQCSSREDFIYASASRTEDNLIICPSGASENTGRIILGVTISIGAPLFEVPGVIGGPATAGVAAILIRLENLARPLHPPGTFSAAGHCPTMSAVHLITRLHPPEVKLNSIGTLNPSMSDMSMKSMLMYWFSANSASVFVVFPVGLALEEPASVAGLAASPAGPVEAAVGVGPELRGRRAGLDVEGPHLATVELPPAARDGGSPHSVGAAVGDVKPSCLRESRAAN